MPALKDKQFFIGILIFHLALYVGLFSDLQAFRSVVGFIYLLFVPGLVIVRLFKFKALTTSERVLFVVCLNLAFLMFIGLVVNMIGPAMGLYAPLSMDILVFTFSVILLPLSFFGDSNGALGIELRRPRSSYFVLLSVVLLLLGFIGIMALNYSGSNFFLLIDIGLIAVIFSVGFLKEGLIPSYAAPLLLLVFAVILLFFVSNDTAIYTNFLTGKGDQWIEYYAFKSTSDASQWISTATSSPSTPSLFPTYSMLSVTILPTIFERITGVAGVWVFKLLYPAIVAFMGIGTFVLYRTQTDTKVAFLASFFFLAVSVGKGWGSDKQLVAQLFFAALIFLLLKKGMPRLKRNVLFLIFSFGLVVSHYSLSYLFMIILVAAWVFLAFLDYARKGSFSIDRVKIPLDLVVIYLTIAFSWYTFVNASEALFQIMDTLRTVMSSIGQFFDIQSRGTALIGLGVVQTPTLLHQVSAGLFFLTEFLIVFGFVWIFLKDNKNFAFEYRLFAAIAVGIIILNLVLPRLADTFLMSRFYQTTLIVLAPLAIIGGEVILKRIPKIKLKRKIIFPILAILIFVPFFLFQTGFAYEVAGIENEAMTLDIGRWDNFKRYYYIVDAREVAGATWLSEHTNVLDIILFSDYRAQQSSLTAYGMIGRGQIALLLNATNPIVTHSQFIFLRPVNVNDGLVDGFDATFNSTKLYPIVGNSSKVYSSGGCEIYLGNLP